MADLAEFSRGLSITDDNDIEKLYILSTNGAPGTTQDHDDAPRGSFAIDELNGKIYTKTVIGAGTNKWTGIPTDPDVTAAIAGNHWRPPVVVADTTTYADLTAAETALNTGTMDGFALSDGDRVLLTSLTTGTEDIYLVSGTPGSGATLIAVPNHTLTDGDTTYVQNGTVNADKQFHYNGTSWIEVGSGSAAEIAFINAYIGKPTQGSVLPQYTSNNYILNNDDLTAAASKLDAQVGTNVANINALTSSTGNIQTEVDAIEASLGTALNTDGTFNGFTGTSLLDTTTSITQAIETLDSSLGANQDDAFIRTFIGKAAAGSELPGYSSTNIVANGDDLEAAIGKLDTFVDKERHEISVSANIGQNVVDSVVVDNVKAVEWHVWAQEVGTQNTRVVFVHGSHNGNLTNDANVTDRAEYVRLRMGNVNGFRTRVTLNGAGASQVMQLEVRTNNSSDLTIVRKVVM